jgi:hypothetical protein
MRRRAPRRAQSLRSPPTWANATTAANPSLCAPNSNDAAPSFAAARGGCPRESGRLRSEPRPPAIIVNYNHARPPGEYQPNAGRRRGVAFVSCGRVLFGRQCHPADRSGCIDSPARGAGVTSARSDRLMMPSCRNDAVGGEAIWSYARRVRSKEATMPYTFTLTATIPDAGNDGAEKGCQTARRKRRQEDRRQKDRRQKKRR